MQDDEVKRRHDRKHKHKKRHKHSHPDDSAQGVVHRGMMGGGNASYVFSNCREFRLLALASPAPAHLFILLPLRLCVQKNGRGQPARREIRRVWWWVRFLHRR